MANMALDILSAEITRTREETPAEVPWNCLLTDNYDALVDGGDVICGGNLLLDRIPNGSIDASIGFLVGK